MLTPVDGVLKAAFHGDPGMVACLAQEGNADLMEVRRDHSDVTHRPTQHVVLSEQLSPASKKCSKSISSAVFPTTMSRRSQTGSPRSTHRDAT